jgi:hypothetical protein
MDVVGMPDRVGLAKQVEDGKDPRRARQGGSAQRRLWGSCTFKRISNVAING